MSGPRLAVMIRCLLVMKAFAHKGDREEDRRTEKGVGGHWGDLLHLASNITPPGNKQGLHENPL